MSQLFRSHPYSLSYQFKNRFNKDSRRYNFLSKVRLGFPILYLDELFEDLDPLISVTAEAKFPNFFDRDKTPRYNFEELERFLNNLVRNWIHKNKDYLKNNKMNIFRKI